MVFLSCCWFVTLVFVVGGGAKEATAFCNGNSCSTLGVSNRNGRSSSIIIERIYLHNNEQQRQLNNRNNNDNFGLSSLSSLSLSNNDGNNDNKNNDDDDLTKFDDRFYKVTLSRATGIEWGTDLSFAYVYVRNIEPGGSAFMSNVIEIGDQLCSLRPIIEGGGSVDSNADSSIINLLGAPFDYVMDTFATLDYKTIKNVELTMFHGTKDELVEAMSKYNNDDNSQKKKDYITINVIQKEKDGSSSSKIIKAPVGCNVRDVLIENKINVYQSITRWTNCKGKQLCGTCIVNVLDGQEYTNRKSIDEISTLRENPDTYRLSCITFAYDDVTIETFPPVNAAQWTR